MIYQNSDGNYCEVSPFNASDVIMISFFFYCDTCMC